MINRNLIPSHVDMQPQIEDALREQRRCAIYFKQIQRFREFGNFAHAEWLQVLHHSAYIRMCIAMRRFEE